MKSKISDAMFSKTFATPQIYEAVTLVESWDGSFSWHTGCGGKTIDSPILLASVTKLFTTACILALKDQGKLSLEDNISKFLDSHIITGLHHYKNHDHSKELTVGHLLFQTSGLPDASVEGKLGFMKRALEADFAYSFEDILQATKNLPAHFIPGNGKKAYYADINFDLLGKIIEGLTALPLHEAYQKFIFDPLELHSTYLPTQDGNYVPYIFYKDRKLQLDQFIPSTGASGGAVSTARELMLFLKAFWLGRMFQSETLESLSAYRHLQLRMMPICYAGGYMRLSASYPLGKKIELVGHTGVTGSFAFYVPQKKLFMVGDLNQLGRPDLPVRLAMKVSLKA